MSGTGKSQGVRVAVRTRPTASFATDYIKVSGDSVSIKMPVVQSVLQGYNGTIMCYGQTGAGKTYTQLGGTSAYEYRGVQPRAIAEIFNYVHDSPQFDATIGVSYLEIYNDTLVDLLASLPSEDTYKEPLSLIEDHEGATHVKGLRVEKVTSETPLPMVSSTTFTCMWFREGRPRGAGVRACPRACGGCGCGA